MPRYLLIPILLVVALLSFSFSSQSQAEQAKTKKCLAYFGTYTDGSSKGIYYCTFDSASGELSMPQASIQDALKNPSFLTVHPNGKYLYAVSETENGSIWSFKISDSGELKFLNKQASGGDGPCYVSIDNTGKVALAANYNSGSVASFPILADGSLGAAVSVIKHSGSGRDPKRQAGPHAHSISVSPNNRFAIACDLGADNLLIYKLNAEKAKISLAETFQVRPGAGPRHFKFSANGKILYVANELSNNIAVYTFDQEKGKFIEEVQLISTVPNPDAPNTVAEIQIDPSGKYLFCSNRGEDSIAVYSIDPNSGTLRPAAYQKTKGQTPRNFTIDPSGNYLIVCNQASNNVLVFKIDQSSGHLLQIEEPVTVPSPVCVKFVP